MSYASRLVQMSKPVAPGAAAVVAPIQEVSQEVEAPSSASPVTQAMPTPDARRATRERVETIEHRVEREHVVHDRVAAPEVTVVESEPERDPMPTRTASWHDEDPAGDPLERVDTNEDLRAVLRAVRAWIAEPTKSMSEPPPAPIEITNVTTNVEAPEQLAKVPAKREAAQIVERREEQTQVSIGNIVITVEDAPTAPRSAAPRSHPARLGETASRLARHYVRGR